MVVIKVNYTNDAPIIKVNYDDAPIYISTSVDATYISVDYGAGDGSAVWGHITGTLSDQTDLQNALDAKVPYTGATQDVDLGEYELKAGQVEFDQTPTGTAGVAVTRWNDSVGTIETTLKGGNVVLRHGRDMFERVVNKTGIQLTKAAYQAVRISNAQGQRLAVQLAQANNDNNSADTIGLVVETIDNNQEGIIYTVGEIDDINTTGSLQGETWVDGDVLYLSPTTAGRITNVKPVAPQHLVLIGYVVYAHANHGKIYVKTSNGFELGELHDVNTTGATNGQVLTYNGTIWTPQTNAAGNIYTTDGTLTGNRTVTMGSYSLSFERDLTINGAKFGVGGGNQNTNVAIGLDALPVNTIGVRNVAIGDSALYNHTTGVRNIAIGTYVLGDNTTGSWNTAIGDSIYGTTTGSNNTIIGQKIVTGNVSNNIILGDGSGNFRLVFNSSGDAVIGGGLSYPTFSGFKLDVLGSGRYSGALTLSTIAQATIDTDRFLVSDSGVIKYRTGAEILSDIGAIGGTLATGQVAYGSGANTIAGSATLTYTPTSSLFVNNSVTAATAIARGVNFTPTLVASANNDVLVGLDIAPTFTTGAFTGTTFYSIRTNGNVAITNSSAIILVNPSGNATTSESIQFNNGRAIFGFDSTVGGSLIQTTATRPINFQLGTTSIARFFGTTGNLLLQNGGTFTDNGQRLQVQGDAFIKGSGNTSGTTALNVQNSSGIAMLIVRNDQTVQLPVQTNFGNVQFYPVNNGGYTLSSVGTELRMETTFVNGTTTGDFGFQLGAFSTHNTSNANPRAVVLTGSFSPTSGTQTFTNALLNASVNQTGGANGITRGLYVNPTLTSAADWRSIEWSNNSGWGLYGAGSANNYMAGSLGIGSTSISQFNLRVFKNITGATNSVGVQSGGVVQSDVTASASYFSTELNTQATTFTLSNGYHYLTSQGTIGALSTLTNQYGFFANSNLIGATNNFGFYGNIPSGTGRWNIYMNGTADNYLAGALGIGTTNISGYNLRISKTLTSSYFTALRSDGVIQSDLTGTVRYFESVPSSANANFNISTIYQYIADQGTFNNVTAGGTVTNQYGFFVNSTLIGATNNFGFYGNIPSGTNRWNLYMNGTANNYMAGSLGIGTTSLTGYNLRITRQITGATSTYGISVENNIASDVTSQYNSYLSNPSTVAASFTITNLRHFYGSQSSFGAGSVVTNQYGFAIDGSLTGATNNYAFWGNIASGTGRWNFFANGTAANYLNGNTIIGGSAVDGGQKLQVNGDTLMKGSGNTLATTALNIQNSDGTSFVRALNNLGVEIGSTNKFTFSSGDMRYTTSGGSIANLQIITQNIAMQYSCINVGTNSFLSSTSFSDSFTRTTTSVSFGSYASFAPTSGTSTFVSLLAQPTINQTGGANGITRGLYINPTLTSAADFRAIEVSAGTTVLAASVTARASLRIPSGTAPTSPVDGDIWFDGTDLKMRIGGVTKTFTLV